MKRHEAVALLKELGAEHLLQPSWVLIEKRKPNSYQLCIKGDYNVAILGFLFKNTIWKLRTPQKVIFVFLNHRKTAILPF